MAEVWQQTRDRFVGDWEMTEFADAEDAADFDRTSGQEVDAHAGGWTRATMRALESAPGFFVADVRGRPRDVALIQREPKYQELVLVGGYVEDTLWVDEGVRGLGLSAELVLAKAEKLGGIVRPERYTEGGLAAHRAAHRLAVQRALRSGFRVPCEVMLDYAEMLDPAISATPRISGAAVSRIETASGPAHGR